MRNYNNNEDQIQDNKSLVNQYNCQKFNDANTVKEENLDHDFLNAIDRDDFKNHFDESQLQEEDPKKEDEDLYEDEIEEPETFEEDGYKID